MTIKKDFVVRTTRLLQKLGITRADICKNTHYNRRTLDRHLDFNHPSLPGMEDIVALARQLSTTTDYLCLGRGVEYVNEMEWELVYGMLERFGNEAYPEYQIIARALYGMDEKVVGLVADVATIYEGRQ